LAPPRAPSSAWSERYCHARRSLSEIDEYRIGRANAARLR
jgi:hypothetical protein